MIKHIIVHTVLGGVIFLVGAVMHDYYGIEQLGHNLATGGRLYAAISLSALLIPLYRKIKVKVDAAVSERTRTKAYDDLLKLKKLLDEKIISQQEYDAKASELKVKFM